MRKALNALVIGLRLLRSRNFRFSRMCRASSLGCLQFGVICLASITSCIAQSAGDFEKDLASIGNQLHFFSDSNGNLKLFIRRQPVRAAVYSEIAGVENDIKIAIKLFSDAANVSHEFTIHDPNIVAYVSPGINSGDKPNGIFLRRIGLPDSVIEFMMKSTGPGWSSGCGYSTLIDDNAQPKFSLALADARLPRSRAIDCVTDGIVRAFGMRTNVNVVMHSENGYGFYLRLAEALRLCEQKLEKNPIEKRNREILRKWYADCSADFLRKN